MSTRYSFLGLVSYVLRYFLCDLDGLFIAAVDYDSVYCAEDEDISADNGTLGYGQDLLLCCEALNMLCDYEIYLILVVFNRGGNMSVAVGVYVVLIRRDGIVVYYG